MTAKCVVWTFVLILMSACVQEAEVTTVYLVRHSEKAAEGGKDPILSQEGVGRAEQLAFVLGSTKPAAIFASGFKRTQLTVAPLAKALQQDVLVRDARDSQGLAEEILEQHRGQVVVVAGHSNTVPEIVGALGGATGPINETQYDNLFMVVIAGKKVMTHHLHFGERD